MKKAALLLVLMASMFTSWAYDFSAVAPTGQTLYYRITSDSTVSVDRPDAIHNWLGFPQPTGTLIIPSTVTHAGTTYTVSAICMSAFWNCDSLASVTIPNTVTSIGSHAFSHCSRLVSVSIPNTITRIENFTFAYCSSLASVVIPNSVTSIGEHAFRDCSNLATVTISASATTIGTSAFSHCSSLTSVSIPNSVTSIGENAFRDCTSLASITIPTSVTTIGSTAFCHCISLTTVAIPSSVTAIQQWTFDSCISLDSVVIPSSVTSIDNYAFRLCSALTAITCKASVPPTLGNKVFWTVPASANVYVPCSSTESYQSNWTYFSNFIEAPYSITVASADTTRGSASVTTQPSCNEPAVITATPYAGCSFLHWSDGNSDNPRYVTLTSDTTLVAIFDAAGTESVTDVDMIHHIVTTEGSKIIVDNASGMRIRIFDSMGRCLSTSTTSDRMRVFRMPTAGLYLVQVADYPAQKVVVAN